MNFYSQENNAAYVCSIPQITSVSKHINYVKKMAFQLDFTTEGFSNIILKNEKDEIQVKTNAFNDEDAWRWKEIFTMKNSVCFNVSRYFTGVRYTFHQKFICMHGDRRHKGAIKTNTGLVLLYQRAIGLLYLLLYCDRTLPVTALYSDTFKLLQLTAHALA